MTKEILTREEVLKLPAGRELDAEVAEAMGLPVVWSSYPPYTSGLPKAFGGKLPYLKGTVNGCEYDWADVPRYSSKIEDAFKVVDHFEHFAIVNHGTGRYEDGTPKVVASFERAAEARTLEVAICHAALLSIYDLE